MSSVTFTTRGALRKSALREANERLILNAVRQNPAISRPDLARITGLSASSIGFIVKRLKERDMLLEDLVENYAQVGRPPTALRLAGDAALAIGVEVALSGSRVAVVNVEGATLRQKVVPWYPGYEIMAERLHAAIRNLLAGAHSKRILGVGVGIPGTLEKGTGRVIAAENLNWADVPLGRLLRGRLGLPFFFENNARASALAERWFGAPGGHSPQDFIFIMPAGGLGAGIVAHGDLLEGLDGMAGEFGHMALHPDGYPCACGNRGCLEQYASDRALWRLYRQETGGEAASPEEIVKLALGGDPAALRAIEKTAAELAFGLVNLVWIFNPEAFVLGGFAAEAWSLVEEPVWHVLRARLPRYMRARLRVVPSRHRADSVLLGAASMVFSRFFNSFEHGDENGHSRPVRINASPETVSQNTLRAPSR